MLSIRYSKYTTRKKPIIILIPCSNFAAVVSREPSERRGDDERANGKNPPDIQGRQIHLGLKRKIKG